MPEASQHPLSDAELTELEACLLAIGGRAPDMEYVDGLFCALLCGPVEVAPQVWLDWLFGELPAEADAAQRLLDLLTRHWNDIARRLALPREALDEDNFYLPLVLENEVQVADGPTLGQHWARGFAAGIGLGGNAWEPLFADDQAAQALAPIVLLDRGAHPEHPDEPVDLNELTDLLPVVVYQLRQWWRLQDAPGTRRSPAKVGRNDPCPCGSGRKYKHCCGAGGVTLH